MRLRSAATMIGGNGPNVTWRLAARHAEVPALRAMATSYPYDQHEDGQLSLRSHANEISLHLKQELQERLTRRGHDTGGADGKIGPRTLAALRSFQRANGMVPSLVSGT